ncbi:MAG TPA: Stealth CR1 domain-containing protein [Propionicimonas sp.]
MAESAARRLQRAMSARLDGYRQVVRAAVLNTMPGHGEGFTSPRVQWREVADWMPADVAADNFRRVTDALDAARVDWWVVSGLVNGRHVVGVNESARTSVLQALARDDSCAGCYVRDPRSPALSVRAGRVATVPELATAPVLEVGIPTRCRGLVYGFDKGTEVEFWSVDPDRVRAPRENRAARELTATEMKLVTIEVAGRQAPTPEVFTRRMIDDVAFDIDVVYTWVDGNDPAWREARTKARGDQDLDLHPSADAAERFHSRDELRYSLRSIAMYAPWVRRVFLVTSGQVPSWLATDNPRLEVVPHSAIYDDPTQLPTFNSNSIISRLHHIPGLSEHYLYFNDDVFLGGPVEPSDFFTPSGLAKVFPSRNRRPFGVPGPHVETHLNLTHNIRSLLEADLGVTVSRAFWHAPHPQLRSVHEELEQRYAAAYATTLAHRFRHHTDIVADQLHHYYVQATGRGVWGHLRYDYFGLDDDRNIPALERLARTRDRHVFCLNDVPAVGTTPISDEYVRQWLTRYFPIPSEFEEH